MLKPGASFLFNVWDRIETNDVANIVTEGLAKLFPDDPPRFLARTPHGHHDQGKLRAELKAAGFARVEIEAVTHRGYARSARDAAAGYCQGTPLRAEIEALGDLERATKYAAEAVAARLGNRAIDGQIQAVVVNAA